MKHYIKINKPKTYSELSDSIKNSIKKIKKENYENYFIYAYNKDSYKEIIKDNTKTPNKIKKRNKVRKPKIYK